jgi:polysaccharide deacetylase family protein (PEP-CTERM system associated)
MQVGDGRTVLLSVDFEDWQQLVRRRLGDADWDRPNPAFPRQVAALLDLLDDVGATATFFLLGMTAKNYPALVEELVARGHEPACHGYAHTLAFLQTPAEFRSDVEASARLIEAITGRRPAGYRAPVFSLNRDTVWAYRILAELGIRWDSSQYDNPRVPHRLRPIPASPYVLTEPGGARLLEIPLTVSSLLHAPLPLGGGGYWRVLPRRVVSRALRARMEDSAALYFHPCEFDPQPLRVALSPGSTAGQRIRAAYRHVRANPGRRHLQGSLRYVAREFTLVSYEHGLEAVMSRCGTRTRALSQEGVLV